MKPRWEVIYHHEFMDGTQSQDREPSQHRSFLGADWYRRFRYRHFGLGSCFVQTEVVPLRGQEDWPRYKVVTERFWPVLYWLRSRWDGLRYGLDRDARR